MALSVAKFGSWRPLSQLATVTLENDRGRPLMQVENPRSQMAKLLREREDIYEKADITIDTEVLSVDEVVEKLIDEMAKRTFETHSDL